MVVWPLLGFLRDLRERAISVREAEGGHSSNDAKTTGA
jgi:hypothetical protein